MSGIQRDRTSLRFDDDENTKVGVVKVKSQAQEEGKTSEAARRASSLELEAFDEGADLRGLPILP